MYRTCQLVTQQGVDHPLAGKPGLPFEGLGYNQKIEVAFAALARVHAAFVMVSGVAAAVIFDLEHQGLERGCKFFADNRRNRAFGHGVFLDGVQINLTLRTMAASFQYKPRFTDIRVKPPKPEEEAAEADVLRLKPGEKPCQWPDCSRAATARAPKSRERLNDFYEFCQPHAGEYNKSWNFYAGMSEGEIRAAKENEAMTGGRPTWEMKAGKASREAAAFAAKMGTANTNGAGSWRDSFGLFGRRGDQAGKAPAEDRRVGKLERGALADLDLEPGADKALIKTRYHELLKRCHPDTNGGDRAAEAKLQRVLKAWRTLKKAGLV